MDKEKIYELVETGELKNLTLAIQLWFSQKIGDVSELVDYVIGTSFNDTINIENLLYVKLNDSTRVIVYEIKVLDFYEVLYIKDHLFVRRKLVGQKEDAIELGKKYIAEMFEHIANG